MITHGGERVTLDTGAPSIYTIGVALGRIPRFCGHTDEFYPVLGHVLVCAKMAIHLGFPEDAIHLQLHDGQESLFADVPTPMKTQVARNREEKVLRRIYDSIGLPWPDDETMERVHEIDHIVLIAEAHVLGHPGAEAQWGTEYDKTAAKFTREQMTKAVSYLDSKTAGTAYVNAFKRYMAALPEAA